MCKFLSILKKRKYSNIWLKNCIKNIPGNVNYGKSVDIVDEGNGGFFLICTTVIGNVVGKTMTIHDFTNCLSQ